MKSASTSFLVAQHGRFSTVFDKNENVLINYIAIDFNLIVNFYHV